MEEVPVKVGDVIGDAYEVERVIGSGGMAVVVAAMDLRQPRRVAVKVLFRKAAELPQILERFEREQRVILQLQGEHVARILDSGVHKGAPYMVMEYLQGHDLAELLEIQGPLPIDQAVDHILQSCEAVAEAHAYDIIHRDLKPGNLFLTRRADGSPCIKVLDFGIAKIIDPEKWTGESTLTHTTAIMGSPYYMSPEQMISSKDVTPASDIWALGVILYELLTGTLPFSGETVERIRGRVMTDDPDRLIETRSDCPEGLESVVLSCLERLPDRRIATAAELAEALAPFGSEGASESAERTKRILEDPSTAAYAPDVQRIASVPPRGDANEATTLYIPRRRRALIRFFQTVTFGILMLVLGGMGGYLVRDRMAAPLRSAPPSSCPPPATPSTRSPSPDESTAPEPVVEPVPIEMDIDKEALRLEKIHRARERKKAEAAAASADAKTKSTTSSRKKPKPVPTSRTPTRKPPPKRK